MTELPNCPSHGLMDDESSLALARDIGDLIAQFTNEAKPCVRSVAYALLIQAFQFSYWCDDNAEAHQDENWKLGIELMLENAQRLGRALRDEFDEAERRVASDHEELEKLGVKIIKLDDVGELHDILDTILNPKKLN